MLYYYYFIIHLTNGSDVSEKLKDINEMYEQGWSAIFHQLMIFEGEPLLVVALDKTQRLPQTVQPVNNAMSLLPVNLSGQKGD